MQTVAVARARLFARSAFRASSWSTSGHAEARSMSGMASSGGDDSETGDGAGKGGRSGPRTGLSVKEALKVDRTAAMLRTTDVFGHCEGAEPAQALPDMPKGGEAEDPTEEEDRGALWSGDADSGDSEMYEFVVRGHKEAAAAMAEEEAAGTGPKTEAELRERLEAAMAAAGGGEAAGGGAESSGETTETTEESSSTWPSPDSSSDSSDASEYAATASGAPEGVRLAAPGSMGADAEEFTGADISDLDSGAELEMDADGTYEYETYDIDFSAYDSSGEAAYDGETEGGEDSADAAALTAALDAAALATVPAPGSDLPGGWRRSTFDGVIVSPRGQYFVSTDLAGEAFTAGPFAMALQAAEAYDTAARKASATVATNMPPPNLDVAWKTPARREDPVSIPVVVGQRLTGREVVEAFEAEGATDVRLLNLANKAPLCNEMVIATGRSVAHMRRLADMVVRAYRARRLPKARDVAIEGRDTTDWMVVDLSDLIVNVFDERGRRTYDLDTLWGEVEEFGAEEVERRRRLEMGDDSEEDEGCVLYPIPDDHSPLHEMHEEEIKGKVERDRELRGSRVMPAPKVRHGKRVVEAPEPSEPSYESYDYSVEDAPPRGPSGR